MRNTPWLVRSTGMCLAALLFWSVPWASADQAPSSAPESVHPTECSSAETGNGKAFWQGKVEKASVTQHSVTVAGHSIDYRATAAEMPMTDEEGELKATVFFVAYERLAPPEAEAAPLQNQPSTPDEGQTLAQVDPAKRPLMFLFNGGPGAASVWLHLGAAGPRRVDLEANGFPPKPPFRLIDNPHTWLDACDLVFIDPVGTGYSRPAEGQERSDFYGVQQDIEWVAEFIRLYITTYKRWVSPLYVSGESYGTTRAAGLSEHLFERHGIALNGIVLVSSVLDFRTIVPTGNNDLPYVLFLPTYTAIAWYHGRLSPDLQHDLDATTREVQQWAREVYNVALAKGDTLPPDERAEVVRQLARYTALPPELIDRAELRIEPGTFRKHLLADRRQVVGRFDGRVTGKDPDPLNDKPDYDPSLTTYFAAYSSTFNDYVRRTLKYESTLPYEVLSRMVWPWDYGTDGQQGYLNVADALRNTIIQNPTMQVLVTSGYYDLATPFAATDHTIDRLLLGDDLRRNIRHTYYEAGHMLYHPAAGLSQLKAEVIALIKSAKTF